MKVAILIFAIVQFGHAFDGSTLASTTAPPETEPDTDSSDSWTPEPTSVSWTPESTSVSWTPESTSVTWTSESTSVTWTEYPTTTEGYPSNYSGPGCGTCAPATVWNDVIYLIDSSAASTRKNLGDMWTYILTVSQSFNIQTRDTNQQQHMRVGVLAYSDQVRLLAPLGSMTYDDMMNLDVPYMGGGEAGTNIEGAIQAATEQFESSDHRANARKVIVLIAPDYNPAGSSAPQKVANTFKADGGILIVLEYQPAGGEPALGLKELSSPDYFLRSVTASIDDMIQAQCDANCVCANNWQQYGSSYRNAPSNGCYFPVDLQGSFALANRNCRVNYQGSYLASVQNYDKQRFLKSLMPNNFLIGLSVTNGRTVWADGTPLGYYHPYQNNAISSGQSVYISTSGDSWITTMNRSPYWYICEGAPCSSNKYCDIQQ